MTTYSYLRVSTDGQDLEKNKSDVLHFANDRALGTVHWVEETISGTIHWRKRKVAAIIDNAAAGDTLIVSELSRLGRSLLEIMEILSVATEKGLKIHALKGNWTLDGSLQSRIMAAVFSIAAEIERDLISQRTKEALAARKKAGKQLGRPRGVGKSKLDAHEPEICGLIANGSSVRFIAARYGVSESNLHRWLTAHGVKR
jgi:DNA invertase Pin-like site-specific DNA recombinase